MIGHRWSPASHELRDFLARNQVPYQWLDVEAHPELGGEVGIEAQVRDVANGGAAGWGGLDETDQPGGGNEDRVAGAAGVTVLRPGGGRGRTGGVGSGGLWDVRGTGDGGRRAGGAGRAGGDEFADRELPGVPVGVERWGSGAAGGGAGTAVWGGVDHAAGGDVPAGGGAIQAFDAGGWVGDRVARGVGGERGVVPEVRAPGVEGLTGVGVYYGAAMIEAEDCRGQEIFVVGGANSAGQAAVFFANYARRVTMLVRGPSLAREMSQYLVDRIEQTANIEVRTRATVAEAHGEGHLEAISIRNEETGAVQRCSAIGLFIFIGAAPRTEWLAGVVERDARGFILSGPDLPGEGHRPEGWPLDRDPFLLETSVPGVFVAGDVRHGSVKRVASGVGEGAIAVSFVHQYLAEVGAR